MVEIVVLVGAATLSHIFLRADMVQAMSSRKVPPLREEAEWRAFVARWGITFMLGSVWLGNHLVLPWNILSIVGYGHLILVVSTLVRSRAQTKEREREKRGSPENR